MQKLTLELVHREHIDNYSKNWEVVRQIVGNKTAPPRPCPFSKAPQWQNQSRPKQLFSKRKVA